MKVFVQDKNGKPLDPTTPARARKLLDSGRAIVVERQPFTIRLLDRSREESYTKDITLGVDAGYSKVGFSAITEEEEVLSGEMELRNDISKKLEQRRSYRRRRRSRNTRYRKPRFDNRKKERGWLAPSIRHKKNAHIRLVEKIKKLLPIDRTVVEVAKFDTQKMQNPEIKGVEYQQGELQGYNVRNYLLEKFGYQCAYCGKENVPLEVEHIIPKSRGGSNKVSNLTVSCHKCNQDKGNQTAEEYEHSEVQEKAEESLKTTAFMNQVRWEIVNELDCEYTYGYVTKKERIELGLMKSHINDAFIIARGNNHHRRAERYKITQRRRNNRAIQMNRKGYGKSIRRKKYELQSGDLVKKDGECQKVKGVSNYGRYICISNNGGKPYWKNENIELVCYGKGLQFN